MKHTEADEQKKIFQWAKLQEKIYPELFWLNGSANGQHIPNAASRKLANLLGRKCGHPDINLPVPNNDYCGLYIEMKIGKNEATPEQQIWLNGLKHIGHYTCVCYSYEEARDVILSYIANRKSHQCALIKKSY